MDFGELDDHEQREIVVLDSRGELPDELAEALRESHNLRSWKGALVQTIQSADAEVARKRSDHLTGRLDTADFEEWRHRNARFKQQIQKRLSECKDLIHDEAEANYVATIRREREELLSAIEKHRDSFDKDEDIPTDGDLELWNLLDRYR